MTMENKLKCEYCFTETEFIVIGASTSRLYVLCEKCQDTRYYGTAVNINTEGKGIFAWLLSRKLLGSRSPHYCEDWEDFLAERYWIEG